MVALARGGRPGGVHAPGRRLLVAARGRPGPEALRIILAAAVRLFREEPGGPLMRALAADAQSDPEIARALREQWLAPRRAVTAEVLRRGVERGELRPGLDPAVTIDLLFAPVYYRLLFTHEPLDEAFADRLLEQALAGIAAPGNSQGQVRADSERTVQ
ncbi:hypothetical protein GXW82_17555 [Streptacidiphilus sp. 4-A2]|nr:hypothetical protein [Streptacidiphilus sp. 4-A2]